MKSVGVVRKIDQLGRYVIPKETREKLNIVTGDSMEIYIDGNSLILKKYSPGCIFCGECDNTVKYQDKTICRKCAERIGFKMKYHI